MGGAKFLRGKTVSGGSSPRGKVNETICRVQNMYVFS